MSGALDYIELGFRAVAHRAEIEEVAARLKPYGDMLKADLPTLLPKIEALKEALFPDDGAAPTYDVRWAQRALNKIDGAGLDEDGQYGYNTRKAVEAFQGFHGLTVDGWLGPKTFAVLSVLARKAGVS